MGKRQKQIIKQQRMAKIAEDRVSAQLLSSDIITAKPTVDINGADLLAIMTVQDGAKFARLQCKGRSLLTPQSSNRVVPPSLRSGRTRSSRPIPLRGTAQLRIIPESYVSGTFTCFVYIQEGPEMREHLLCFFAFDIKQRWQFSEEKREYYLSLYGKTFQKKYDLFYFYDSRVRGLKDIIRDSAIDKEFHYLFAKVRATLPAFQCSASASLGSEIKGG